MDALREIVPLPPVDDANTTDPGAAMLRAEDVLFVWPAIPDQRLHVVKTGMPLDALESSLGTPDSFVGRELQPGTVADRRIWRDAPTSQAVSVPAPNLLVTGPYSGVEAAVWRVRTDQASAIAPFTHDLEGAIAPGPLQRAAIARSLGRPELSDIVRRTRRVEVTGDVADGLTVDIRATLEPDASPDTVRALGVVLVREALEQVLIVEDAASRVASESSQNTDGTWHVRWSVSLDASDVIVLAALLDPDVAAALPSPDAPDVSP